MRYRLMTVGLALACLWGCGDGGGGAGGSGGTGGSGGMASAPVARFSAPAATPVDAGQVPYPSDLYLDANGKIRIGTLPSTVNAQFDMALHAAWPTVDGWGVSTGVFFFVDGALDAATVSGSVHLYDLATGDEVPVAVGYHDVRGSIGAVPAPGNTLAESHRYAAVLTDAPKGKNGLPIQPSADFAMLRNAASPPADPRLARAYQVVAPALAKAAAKGIPAARIVAATSFQTQTTVTTMEKLREALDAAAVPPITSVLDVAAAGALDARLGIPITSEEGMDAPGMGTANATQHAHIGYVINANLRLNGYTAASPFELGLIELDPNGTPMVKGTYEAAFTLVLPAGLGSYANLPLVVFIPGVKHARSDMFAIADGFAANGAAVAAVDLPFHGSRTPNPTDVKNNVTGASCPSAPPCDFIGDSQALNPPLYFFNLSGGPGVLSWDPRAVRDNFRQGAADVMQLARALTAGANLAAIRTSTGHSELSFRPDVAVVAHSLGAFIATAVAAIDPRFKVIVLDSVGAGVLVPTLVDAPWFGTQLVPMIQNGFGILNEFSDGPHDPRFHPSLLFLQAPIEPGDAIGFGRYVVRDPSHRGGTAPHVWVNAAHLDQVVPNQSSEPFGADLGATRVMLSIQNPTLEYAMMSSAPAPYAPASGPTAAFVMLDPATHSSLYWTHDAISYQPPFPPFTMLATPMPIDNPTVRYHRALESFVMDFFAGQRPRVKDPYTCNPTGC